METIIIFILETSVPKEQYYLLFNIAHVCSLKQPRKKKWKVGRQCREDTAL